MSDRREDEPRLSAAERAERARRSLDRMKAMLAPFREQKPASVVELKPDEDSASAEAWEAGRRAVMARIFEHQNRPRRDDRFRAGASPQHPDDKAVCEMWALGQIEFKEMLRRLAEQRKARQGEA